MKRAGRPKLSFDELSDEAEEGESKPKLPRIQRGVPQLPESKQVETEKTVPEAQSLAQVAALRAALGLGRTKQEEKQLDSEDLAAQPPKLPASMRDIQTFSEFLRLSPAIQEASMKMSADELTALCETAARLKFFDGELFEAVFVHIRCRIRWGQFDVHQVTAVAQHLVDLNATDPEVFRDMTQWLQHRVSTMSKAQRLQWLKLLAAAGNRNDEDEDFEEKLRTQPLPGGVDISSSDDFMVCWDFVRTGSCPRGPSCRWNHPS